MAKQTATILILVAVTYICGSIWPLDVLHEKFVKYFNNSLQTFEEYGQNSKNFESDYTEFGLHYTDRISNKEKLQTAVEVSLDFLRQEFGQPVVRISGMVIDEGEADLENSHVEISENRQRLIKFIQRDYFVEGEYEFIVHELFHAFYQSDELLKHGNIWEIEGFATYAQLRFKYRGSTNQEILNTIMENRQQVLLGASSRFTPAVNNTEDLRLRYYQYVSSAIPLFQVNHRAVRDWAVRNNAGSNR